MENNFCNKKLMWQDRPAGETQKRAKGNIFFRTSSYWGQCGVSQYINTQLLHAHSNRRQAIIPVALNIKKSPLVSNGIELSAISAVGFELRWIYAIIISKVIAGHRLCAITVEKPQLIAQLNPLVMRSFCYRNATMAHLRQWVVATKLQLLRP